jgi:hypothetical protein
MLCSFTVNALAHRAGLLIMLYYRGWWMSGGG